MGRSFHACASPPREGAAVRNALEHAAGDAADRKAGDVVEPVNAALEDRLGRPQSAADGRSDALAQIARGQAGSIPGNEGIVAPDHRHLAAQKVAVAGRVILRPGREATAEHGGEAPPVLADVLAALLHARGDAADADIQPAALLGHVPRVTGQPVLEEPQVAVRILPVVLDLVFQRDNLQLAGARIQLAEQLAVDRTAGAARADQIAAAVRAVDDIAVAVGADVAHVVLLQRSARTLEQPGVELDAA